MISAELQRISISLNNWPSAIRVVQSVLIQKIRVSKTKLLLWPFSQKLKLQKNPYNIFHFSDEVSCLIENHPLIWIFIFWTLHLDLYNEKMPQGVFSRKVNEKENFELIKKLKDFHNVSFIQKILILV